MQNKLKQRRTVEKTEEDKNCRTVRTRPDLQNIEEVVRIDTPVLLVIQSFIYNHRAWVVLGRTVVLLYLSWFLNIGSCSFHLVVARKQGGAWENIEAREELQNSLK